MNLGDLVKIRKGDVVGGIVIDITVSTHPDPAVQRYYDASPQGQRWIKVLWPDQFVGHFMAEELEVINEGR